MRIEIDKYGNRNEYADGGNWLYQDRGENDRYFTDMVLLGKHEEPWDECIDEKRKQWEEEHKSEPEPEPETKEKEE